MGSAGNVGTAERPLRVAIVGSGPGGFYAAVALLKQKEQAVEVDLFDRLPTPYGLVRGGVAPDHQKMKSVTRIFDQAASLPGFRFFGNVTLGKDVTVADLREHYHQIVYAVGNEDDRRMGIPGEEHAGCAPATVFVGWYNAHPDHRDAEFDFTCRRAVVIGNGNVAVDVARILAKSPEELAETDIADHALEALRHSRIEEILMLGRRGPVQASFTPVELRELGHLEHTGFTIDPRELELDPRSRATLDAAGEGSPVSKNFELLEAGTRNDPAAHRRNIRLRFLASPAEILGDDRGRVRGLRIERNELVEKPDGTLAARGTGRFEEVEAGLVLVSIGYRGRPVEGVPFDDRRGVIPNRDGRVLERPDGAVLPGQYVVGWAMSGPRGLIGIHKKASGDVARLMLEDVAAGAVPHAEDTDPAAVPQLLERRGVSYVTYAAWQKIDAAEVERGSKRGAPRCKFSRVAELLAAGR